MFTPRVIFFDCMETLVDMYEVPGEREYALWAFEGSGAEKYWDDFREFLEDFGAVRRMLKDRLPYHQEYDLKYRLTLVAEKKARETENMKTREKDKLVENLAANFWWKYKEKCYVAEEVADTIFFLAQKGYRMGVVSNFLINGGIEELLTQNKIDQYFDFVVTSVAEGWKKPHPRIYEQALAKAGATAKEALFIGDDYLNDYLTPEKMGFAVLLLDRRARYPHVKNRFGNFKELNSFFG